MLKLVKAQGVSGYEENVAKLVEKRFNKVLGNACMDKFFNVTTRMGKGKPVIYCSAHIDEIGLMITTIEEDGFLGICSIGGVDPRILMAQEVTVHTQSGPVFGVIGAKPPHILNPEDVKKAPKMHDLFIDLGFSVDKVKEMVSIGNMVTFNAPPIKLLNSRIASKSMDDRMGVAVMLEAAKFLKNKKINATVVFCASVQEEIGAKGALVSAYGIDPDMAVAIDVTHAKTPDAKDTEAYNLDDVCLGLSAFCDRNMLEIFKEAAKKQKISIDFCVSGGRTGTDGDQLQIVREGVPISVLEIPLKYMHTTVETLSYKTVKKAGKLLGQFILEVGGAS
ncbi:MAG: M20/M25/M40 family metallo-hydrolase [Clostridiales bacterium]|nr:M20/M25/M40 family metallo-hydrolase [Clostridiales bacterium]